MQPGRSHQFSGSGKGRAFHSDFTKGVMTRVLTAGDIILRGFLLISYGWKNNPQVQIEHKSPPWHTQGCQHNIGYTLLIKLAVIRPQWTSISRKLNWKNESPLSLPLSSLTIRMSLGFFRKRYHTDLSNVRAPTSLRDSCTRFIIQCSKSLDSLMVVELSQKN